MSQGGVSLKGTTAVVKRKSGQGSATNSPPSQHRVPVAARGIVTVSPIGSPPLGGAITPLVAEVAHSAPLKEQPHAVRSAGSLMGNVPDRRSLAMTASKSEKAPPTPRGKTPRMPKKTPRMSPRSSLVNGAGPKSKALTEEEEKRRTANEKALRPEGDLRRSASGSRMEGAPMPQARANGVAGYPTVQPPSGYAGVHGTVSGSTTPTDGGEGVPYTLLSRLRNNPVLQVQDSRIMRLIGKRSVLKSQNGDLPTVRAKPCLGRHTPMTADAEEPEAESRPRRAEAEPEFRGQATQATTSGSEAQPLVESFDKDADAVGKVTNLNSPRNHVVDAVDAVEDDDPTSATAAVGPAPIVWPGAPAEESTSSSATPVERQPQESVSVAASVVPAAVEPTVEATAPTESATAAPAPEEVPVYTPAKAVPAPAADMPLLQNEAGSLVVPQTWRFVPPPLEQAPKPCYDKVLEAKAAAAAVATPPAREDATPSASREDLTPKKLIEDLVQDQVKLDLRDKQLLVEQLVECLIDQVKRYEKELGAEQRANRALKMSLEVEQRKALMYHQRLSELASQQLPFQDLAARAEDHTLEPEL